MRLLPILLLFLSFCAAAQAPAKLPRLCFLALDPDAATSPRFKPFFDGLRDVGLIDGSTITIDIRSTIPIIMHPLIDPVGAGLVKSLARPGGNVTGLSMMGPAVSAKRLELLRQAFPRLT